MKRTKIIVINLFIFLTSFLVLEMFVKYFTNHNFNFYERNNRNIKYLPSGTSIKWMIADQNVYETTNGEVLFDKRKYKINKRGLRSPSYEYHKIDSNIIKIAIVGGSHVFDAESYDYKNEFSFSQKLENLLNSFSEKQKFKVLNCGIPGSSTISYNNLILLELSQYKPDYIIINSIWNDLKWIYNFDYKTQLVLTKPQAVEKNPFIEKTNILDNLIGWSAIYRKLRDAYYRYKYSGALARSEDIISKSYIPSEMSSRKDIQLGLKQYTLNIESIINSCKLIGAEPIIAIEERLPSLNMDDIDKQKIAYKYIGDISHNDLIEYFNLCDSVLKNIAFKNNLNLINISNEMKGYSKYFKDHIHVTNDGSSFIAKEYFKFLNEKVLMIDD